MKLGEEYSGSRALDSVLSEMKNDIEIRIPAEIAALPLSLQEKVVLAHIHKLPGCSNNRLAELIGISCRGIEAMLHRMRRKGYIEPTGKGRARRHYLLFPVERHTECGITEKTGTVPKSRTQCGGQKALPTPVSLSAASGSLRKEISWEQDLSETLTLIQDLIDMGDPFPDSLAHMYGRVLKRVEAEAPNGVTKERIVRFLSTRRDAMVAIHYGTKLPRHLQYDARRLIRKASPEMLARFRERVEDQSEARPMFLLSVLKTRDALSEHDHFPSRAS